MKMKKLLLFAGLAAATLSFVGCNKQEVEVPENNDKFAIRLVTPETKTVNDGMSTKWADEDSLSVFYAKAGSTSYSENNRFQISSPDSGVANADITLGSGSYDWYAFYPYNKYFTSPANNNDNPARTYIGGRSDKSQTQAGYDSKDHIAGTAVPMYGIVKGVSSTSDPVIQMKHIAAVAEIVVTNNSGKAVKITDVELSAPDGVDIVGQYNITFDGEPVFTKYKDYQSNTAKLTVEGAKSLSNGASAKFYLVVKPFEAKTLTVKVTTEDGSDVKTANLSSAASFQAGHIKTLNVPFEKAQTITNTLAEILAMSDGESVTTNEVLVVAKASVGLLVKEGSDYLYVYDKDKTSIASAKVGDKVVLEGTTGSYKGAKQLVSPTVTVKSSNNTVKHPTAKDITESFDTYEATYGEMLTYKGKLSVNADKGYYNITVDGASTRVGSIVAPADNDATAINNLDGKNVKVTGYYLYITGKYLYVIATEVKEDSSSSGDGNTLSMTMSDYVSANNCTVSSGSDVTTYPILQLNKSVRMYTTGTGNCGSFWVTSSSNDAKQWRLYQKQSGDVTILVANGCQLKSVTFTYATSNGGTLLDASGTEVKSGSKQTVSGTSVTYTVGNTGDADNGQVRITAVEVVYTGSGTTFPAIETTTTITMASSLTLYVGETGSLNATSNVDAKITYESEDSSIATVDASGTVTGVAEGTVKVYARIAGVSGKYTDAERYCNVTVSTKPEETEGTEVIIFSELNYANDTEVVSVQGENFSMAFDKGEGRNAPKYYDNGKNVRIYNLNTVTFTSKKTITKIEFYCTSNYDVNAETTFSAGSCTDNVWAGSAKSITMLNGSSTQIRLTGIKVTFE